MPMLRDKRAAILSIMLLALFTASITFYPGINRSTAAVLPPSIRKPLPTLPAPVLNGSWILVEVSGPSSTEGWSIWIEAPGHTYNLTSFKIVRSASKPGLIVLNVSIPGKVAPGLYDLYVDTGSGVAGSPRSVWVLSKWPDKLTIAHLTDVHIGVIAANGRTAINYAISEVMLINMLPVDLVVVTGDNADVGAMVWHHRVFLQVLNLLRKPSIVVPGNHDYAGDPTLHNYLTLVGYRYHATRIGKFLLVGLDSGSEGYFDSEELKWAENLLAENGNNSTIIMFWHHPPFQATVAGVVSGDPAKGVFTVKGVKVNSETHRPEAFTGSFNYKSKALFYSSWVNHPDQLKRILTWTQKYNIPLILNGHVHNDGTVLFNNKTWFVTTSPAGGPAWTDTPGSHHGFRIVDVYANGTVRVWKTNGKPVFSDFNAIDMEKAEADLIYGADSATLELHFKDLPDLKFIPSSYEIWVQALPSKKNMTVQCSGLKPESIETYKTTRASYYVIKPSSPLKANANYSIAVYAEKDTEKPEVSIVRYQPSRPTPRSGVKLTVKATDKGWGVRDVYVDYMLPGGQVKTLKATPQYGGSVNAFVLPHYFTVTIPPVSNIPESKPYIEVRARAIDAAGNKAETGWVKIVFRLPQTTTTTPTTTTTTTTSTSTTTTTTTSTTSTTTTTTTIISTTTTTTMPQSSQSSTSTGGGEGVNIELIVGVVVVALIIVAIIAAISRRS